jgi:two-component system cell cycle response regulator DivK
MMAVYLTINNFQVVEAVNGAEAIELAVKHRPDLILMDVAMPVLDGIDSTKAIRLHDELRDIPIVCLTAFGDLYEERAMEAGCDEVAAKPVDFNKLDQLIRQHMS